jgi:Family of unknown function (DUF6166)
VEYTVAQYVGTRVGEQCSVLVDGEPLRPRLDLKAHSAKEFDWGYISSACAQLALAIVAHHCEGNLERALRLYVEFTWRVVENLPRADWRLNSEEIEAVLGAIEASMKGRHLRRAKRTTPKSRYRN